MSAQKPNLWRVLSDACRIIRSNPLHFLALSALFIFPVSLLNIIYTLTVQPTPFQSHYGRLLFTVSKQEYSVDKSQTLFQFLYGLLLLLINLCSVASITHSIFNGFQSKPLKLSSSLKSILSSFFPLLATKIAYIIILGVIFFGFGLFMAFVFIGLALLGVEIDPSSKYIMAAVFLMAALPIVVSIYLEVEWIFMNAIVVVESKYGFAPFQRSSSLVKGKRVVALLMMLLFSVLGLILSAWYSTFVARSNGNGNGGSGTCRGWLVLHMVVYGGVSTILSLFNLAANTVFFVHCKAFNGELELEVKLPSYDKLGQVYVQLPLDVADHV
ncbi:hypothetical protein C2S52_015974 [Perilla frutescens var. hirtella]|nr:hypothetical protein C2S52_015974 [Perilla frutescens var. hirtella]